MKLALFGGTFDPIHNAHLALARSSAARLGLDRVLFVPAFHPPHKDGVTYAPYEDRLRMVELACAGEERFEASRLEEGTTRGYSIETIEKVQRRLSRGDELFFLIGADAFAEIQTWYRWQDVARAVRFVVASRPGHRYAVPAEVRLDRLDGLDWDVSSSAIRGALAAGERPPGVPDPVLDYIARRGLYRGRALQRVCPPAPEGGAAHPRQRR